MTRESIRLILLDIRNKANLNDYYKVAHMYN